MDSTEPELIGWLHIKIDLHEANTADNQSPPLPLFDILALIDYLLLCRLFGTNNSRLAREGKYGG